MNDNEIRLDIYLTKFLGVQSRARAKQMIDAGYIKVNGITAEKPALFVSPDDNVTVENTFKYVSRGGLKMEKALKVFSVDPEGKTILDIGASTGGFTDCLLQNGASEIYAVDVGHSQLAEKLRNDPRVINLENTHIKDLQFKIPELINCFNIITVDVSFISLTIVLAEAVKFMNSDTDVICLLKPQYEAGKTKNGIISNINEHKKIVKKVLNNINKQGFSLQGFDFSPIKGGDGNIEYLIHLKYSNEPNNINFDIIESIIENSHKL